MNNDFDFEVVVPAFHEDIHGNIQKTNYDQQVFVMYITQILANIFDDNKRIKIDV